MSVLDLQGLETEANKQGHKGGCSHGSKGCSGGGGGGGGASFLSVICK